MILLVARFMVLPFQVWWYAATNGHAEWPDLEAFVLRYDAVQRGVALHRAAGLQPPPEWLAELTEGLTLKE